MTTVEVDTRFGPARAEVHLAPDGIAALVLGHGAGGGFGAKDLVTVARAAQAAGVHVALAEQPYRVAGRRTTPNVLQLDEAWLRVVDELAKRWFDGLPLVFGGRSSGARVACRTAEAGGAVAVLCLAFPVRPPWNKDASRQDELDAVAVPTLVVQGENDQFGRPEMAKHHELVLVRGNHTLDKDLDVIDRAVTEWLARVLRPLS